MNDTIWFLLALWLCLILIGYIFKKPVITILGALFGFYLGFEASADGFMITLVISLVNIYISYSALDDWDL